MQEDKQRPESGAGKSEEVIAPFLWGPSLEGGTSRRWVGLGLCRTRTGLVALRLSLWARGFSPVWGRSYFHKTNDN